MVRQIVMYHHEKLDGTGYPEALHGANVPDVARIASIVNVYDALTTHRPYRPAMSHPEAIALMKAQMAPAQLDPEYFTAFERFSDKLPHPSDQAVAEAQGQTHQLTPPRHFRPGPAPGGEHSIAARRNRPRPDKGAPSKQGHSIRRAPGICT